ncbi:dihydrolipoyllysine-residue succinyltransferase [Candidatus Rhabdochlamydia sp. T3358]|uniref:dihydrolipoyllysine-residue succinyltransferase n=1 Tax=Candidatus Rhabdochlamydia sp. T3358 TaxID=2099795 RepID=UPI0010BBCDF7|nr:dihydrolipoyllysine-residue succinyltransferase [Candidatus Rhabdochlamydia sp. T3358]VHO02865.1 Dihydrolipoyllysine-residue succinyltransferase component of 2-oxoglutarate dehydrogenase complex [Candidatus Rhabdochlamydia sp. T3358]
MPSEIKIPNMGESVSEAIISNILKSSGSFVKQDEEILELETDKVNQVLYAPESGKLTLQVKKGDTVKIGQVIGTINPQAIEQPLKIDKEPPEPAFPPPSSNGKAKFTTSDFVSSLQQPAASTQPTPVLEKETNTSRKKMSSLRKIIAQKLVEVKNTTAMLTTFNEVDMSSVIAIRQKEQESFQKKYGIKLGFMSFFIKACVAALKEIPEVNAYIDKEDIVLIQSYDICVAVSTDRGLMVPVIRSCEQHSFGEIEIQLSAFAQKARDGSISVDDLKGGSFTITNGGVFGSLLSTPILNPPQSAILGMHSIVKRPVVVDDEIVIRPMMYLALSYDHRLIDGKQAVLFLKHIKQTLEEPSRLLLDL